MIIALLLAAAQPGAPDQSRCGDQPYIKECGNDRARREIIRFFMRDGGYSRESAEEVADWPLDRLMRQMAVARRCGPEDVRNTAEPVTCNRNGWNPSTHRYASELQNRVGDVARSAEKRIRPK